MATINFKRGDTFSLSCVYKVDDINTSVAPITIAAQIRNSDGDLVEQLTASKPGTVGLFILTASAAQTLLWDIDLYKCDIQFTENNVVRSSTTFLINVVEDVTR